MNCSVTVILAVRNLEGERLRNFQLCTFSLSKLGIPILVLEQVAPGKSASISANIGLTVKTVEIDSPFFHKTKVMNTAGKMADSEWLWFMDSDIIFDWRLALERLASTPASVIVPIDRVIWSTIEETEALARSGKVSFGAGDKRATPFLPGPYTFMVRKEYYFEVGGMNETFVGYGCEDVEFMGRAMEPGAFEQWPGTCIHLHHERLHPRRENLAIFKPIRTHYGLGDTVAGLAHLFWIDRLVKAVLGRCNCSHRRFLLNRSVPWRRKWVRRTLAALLPLP